MLQNKRDSIGIELKESYWNIAYENLSIAKTMGKLDYGNNGKNIKPKLTKGNYGNNKLSDFLDKKHKPEVNKTKGVYEGGFFKTKEV